MRRYALAFPLIALLFLVACGNDDDGPTIFTPTAPPDETAADEDNPPADDGNHPTAEPTLTPEGGEDTTPEPERDLPVDETGAPILPCNDILVPVDKEHRLPADCVPEGLVALPDAYSYGEEQLLVQEAADAFIEMRESAADDGMNLYARSSYRSYETQEFTYNHHVSNHGQEYADRISARPGHSEHQLGTTTDVTAASAGYELSPFGDTPESEWVEQNSWRYGFIVSYPEGKEHITGYVWEPWHIRYVGRDVAREVHESGLTLGEYLHETWW